MVEVGKQLFILADRQKKKWWSVKAIFLVASFLVACQQSPNTNDNDKPDPIVTQTEAMLSPTSSTAQVQATATLIPFATANVSPLTSAPSAKAGSKLAIESFEVISSENTNSGKRITLSWRSNGQSARIISGVRRSGPPWWQIPASGTITVELEESNYNDPPFTLQVFDAGDLNQATEVIEAAALLQWPCNHNYFFEPAPALCPAHESIVSAAAEQPFEGGVMIWLEATDSIYIFIRNDTSWQRFEDTWSEGQPESDPAIVPPAERFQPIRGFGKVWRDNPEAKEKLGWALGPELGFESVLQEQKMEHEDTAVSFLKTFNGQVFALTTREPDEGDWVIATS